MTLFAIFLIQMFDIPATSQHQEFSAFSVNSLTANHK
jgi:hypothetical protein